MEAAKGVDDPVVPKYILFCPSHAWKFEIGLWANRWY